MADWSDDCAFARGGSLKLRRVRRESEADDEAIKVTLFRGAGGAPCGWFVAPLLRTGRRFAMPYLPQSAQTLASVAIVRAIRLATETGHPLCLIDPEDLWDIAWQA